MKKRVLISGALAVALAAALLAVGSTVCFAQDQAAEKTTITFADVGWDSIMYIAPLSAVDPQLYEAAVVDGANKWQKMRSIDIPLLMPTAVVLFILRAGSVMSVGFEKVYLLQNDLNISASEIISTYVYKMGLKSNQYSYSAAIGLFNNVVNFILLLSVNFIASKMGDTSLF